MKDELKKAVKHCAEKASTENDSNEALKFSQAALNAANAMRTLADIKEL